MLYEVITVVEVAQPLGAGAQLSGRLRTAQQQQAEDADLLGENSKPPKPVLQKRCLYLLTRLPKPLCSPTRCFFSRSSSRRNNFV